MITRRLGAGAMGTVYEARDPDLSRNVALKILRETGQHHSLRFLREAQTLAQLQHPNVVVIHDVGVTGDAVFIAMELVEGENLREYLAGNALSWSRVLAIYMQAGRGLAAAHEKSIVHRDFKPANVLIDRQGRVRVTDFGLARLVAEDTADADAAPSASFTGAATAETVDNSADAHAATVDNSADVAHAATIDSSGDAAHAAGKGAGLLDSPLTYDGALLGTPRYMAPEQHARRRATARSDQFAFCVCVWEAVFGAHPFPHGQNSDTKPTRSERSAPGWLVRALETGLAFDPARRHPTMDALLDALERAPRIRRRMWTAAGALAVVIAASLITLGVRSTSDPCGGVAPLEAWTTEARVSTRNAFLATGLPFAGQIHDGVARRLDDYATRWHAMKVDTCRADKSSSAAGAALSERRNLCLDRRQDEVGAMVAALRVITRDG
ncbi:MAG TPA: serine/threonine-protein kinase, partial [Kofleriaceae bacterium]|nr:serine/threonine-protein kinase [Kofleriaceae bacterium]